MPQDNRKADAKAGGEDQAWGQGEREREALESLDEEKREDSSGSDLAASLLVHHASVLNPCSWMASTTWTLPTKTGTSTMPSDCHGCGNSQLTRDTADLRTSLMACFPTAGRTLPAASGGHSARSRESQVMWRTA